MKDTTQFTRKGERLPQIHDLKCWPEYFEKVRDGIKQYEFRKNDRDFQVGDILVLRCYDPVIKSFVHPMALTFRITDVFADTDLGVPHGMAILSLRPIL